MTSDALSPEDVWLLPGWQNSGPGHWQSLWQQQYGYRRLEQHNWQHPLRGDWSIRLQELVLDAPRPVTLVAHSLGCVLVAWWAAHSQVAKTKVSAALLVAPAIRSRTACVRFCRAGRLCCSSHCPSVDTGGQRERCQLHAATRRDHGQGLGQPFCECGFCRPYQPGQRTGTLGSRA